MVVDPTVLVDEIRSFRAQGFLARHQDLVVAARAHLTMPYHREIDRLRDERPENTIGTTRKGIGPTYESKAARTGVRVGDLLHPERFRGQLARQIEHADAAADGARRRRARRGRDRRALSRARGRAAPLRRRRVASFVHDAIVRGDNVMFEGAQGVLLDIDHGTYPFVTSSSTTAGGACAGLGIGPT